MTEEPIKYIKMADGTLVKVEYLTEESEQPEYVRRLSKAAREAGQNAIKQLLAASIPASFMENGNLIRLYPDGHKEIFEENILKSPLGCAYSQGQMARERARWRHGF